MPSVETAGVESVSIDDGEIRGGETVSIVLAGLQIRIREKEGHIECSGSERDSIDDEDIRHQSTGGLDTTTGDHTSMPHQFIK
jgi:hypothetical protein